MAAPVSAQLGGVAVLLLCLQGGIVMHEHSSSLLNVS
jgi:hypothetical protein